MSSRRRLPLVTLAVLLAATFWPGSSSGLASHNYSTSFPLVQSPISEVGTWIGGASASSAWGNVQTVAGMAFGVSEPTTYGDPTAILAGTWGPNQTVREVVKVVTTPTSPFQEVEARLLSTISPGKISGYEINCSVVPGTTYIQLVRWNGANGDFMLLDDTIPASPCRNGDVLVASVVVSGGTKTFTVSVNGVVQTFRGCGCTNPKDSVAGSPSSGSPGMGFYNSTQVNWNYFGFSSFSATDGTTTVSLSPPANLNSAVQ
jgi:hypothetical protein